MLNRPVCASRAGVLAVPRPSAAAAPPINSRRDSSFQPRSEAGLAAWDVFQCVRETARKLGISFVGFLKDRIIRLGDTYKTVLVFKVTIVASLVLLHIVERHHARSEP